MSEVNYDKVLNKIHIGGNYYDEKVVSFPTVWLRRTVDILFRHLTCFYVVGIRQVLLRQVENGVRTLKALIHFIGNPLDNKDFFLFNGVVDLGIKAKVHFHFLSIYVRIVLEDVFILLVVDASCFKKKVVKVVVKEAKPVV